LPTAVKSLASGETQRLFRRQPRKLPRNIQPRALMPLLQTDAAMGIDDLRLPSSDLPEHLKGTRKGQWSVRINDQWRVCIRFERGQASDGGIVDYHGRR
jgi:proteic killer suppression protein